MIRVNLIRNRVQDTSLGDAGAGTSLGGGGGGASGLRDIVVKGACIFMFTIGMMIYESQNIRALNAELNQVQAQVNQLTEQNQAKIAELAKYKDVEVQAKELEDKLKILKLLSKLRLREVKTLDFMQSSIPEKVWLKTVQFESDKGHVEQGHFQFTGNSVATEDLTEFVRRLEDSAYLQDVIVVKNQENTANANSKSTVREFLFTADVETKN